MKLYYGTTTGSPLPTSEWDTPGDQVMDGFSSFYQV